MVGEFPGLKIAVVLLAGRVMPLVLSAKYVLYFTPEKMALCHFEPSYIILVHVQHRSRPITQRNVQIMQMIEKIPR